MEVQMQHQELHQILQVMVKQTQLQVQVTNNNNKRQAKFSFAFFSVKNIALRFEVQKNLKDDTHLGKENNQVQIYRNEFF